MADIKTGFKYYNVDTDRYQDMKIKRLKKKFKCDGIAVYDYILCEIYRVKGCFIDWDDNSLFDVADYFGIEESLVSEIIVFCCSIGLFDKTVFSKISAITSHSIQERFIDMSIRAKRISIEIPEKLKVPIEKQKIIQEESPIIQESNKEKSIYEKIDEAANYLTCPEEQAWRDIAAMQNKLTIEELVSKINEFTGLQKERGEVETPKEFRKHFTNWLKIEIEKQKKLQNGNSIIQSKTGFGNSGNRSNPGITSSEDKRAKRQTLSDMAEAILQNP